MKSYTAAALVAAYATYAAAQTSTSCNPTKQSCPSDPALGKSVFYDFTQGAPEDFTISTGAAPTFTKNGAEFTISKSGEAPTISSKWFMMFGYYEVVVQTSKGTGIVSSVVLQSDDLDEIDWEWLGSDDNNVQTNYYGKGNTAVYNRGETIPNAQNQDSFMTYSLDWTADSIVWAVNGKTIRTLTPATADTNQYPQTPMQLKIGTWSAGDSSEPAGTVAWAGGSTNYADGPFTMTVKSVKAIDYSTGTSYSYGDETGNWQSIKSNGGKIESSGNSDASASTAAAGGSSISQVAGHAATDVPVSGTSAPPTVTSGIAAVATGAATSLATSTHAASGTGATSSNPSQTSAAASAVSTAHSGAAHSFGSSAASVGMLAMLVAALAM